MTLVQILALAGFTLLAGRVANAQSRRWLLLAGSVLAIYWMQPSMPIRYLDFWLPTAALGLTLLVWAASRPSTSPLAAQPAEKWSAVIILACVLLVAALRYVQPLCCLTPTRPPQIGLVAAAAVLTAAGSWGLLKRGPRRPIIHGLALLAVLLLAGLKTPRLAQAASTGLRALMGQQTALASPLDIRWLGLSYLIFRLVHVLRDASAGRLPRLALDEFVLYALFYPAYTAGPIDRVQRFVRDLRAPLQQSEHLLPAGQRIAAGVFKKFALADTLALIALNNTNAAQVTPTGWAWVLLYAYTLRIYLDFSGYTDIAIGLGRLAGIRLPENFQSPYRKPNLTAFWNNWHITLAQWFRAYYFNPLIRALRLRRMPVPLVILLTQLTTMILIGLWHGVQWNFLLWGAWHGVGLFFHNRWSEKFRSRYTQWVAAPRLKRALNAAGAVLTFHFVALGWVWFALTDIQTAWGFFLKLFGG